MRSEEHPYVKERFVRKDVNKQAIRIPNAYKSLCIKLIALYLQKMVVIYTQL